MQCTIVVGVSGLCVSAGEGCGFLFIWPVVVSVRDSSLSRVCMYVLYWSVYWLVVLAACVDIRYASITVLCVVFV